MKKRISNTEQRTLRRELEQRTVNGEQPTLEAEHVAPMVEFRMLDEEFSNDALREGQSRRFDLEDRLLEFASAIIDLSEKLPTTRAAQHIAGQILRSGTSPLPNHGEAESAESREDFIHKLKLCLKELRETRRWARLIQRQGWAKNATNLIFVLGESEELIRIFAASLKTAQQNLLAEKRGRGKPTQSPQSAPF